MSSPWHIGSSGMGADDIKAMLADGPDDRKVIVDVKSILDKAEFADYRYWRL